MEVNHEATYLLYSNVAFNFTLRRYTQDVAAAPAWAYTHPLLSST
jgi:hypothetical protein